MARPSKYTEATAALICDRIAEGESLRTICSEVDMPDLRTVRRWLSDEKREAFRLQYAYAREEQADFYAEEIISIVDTEEDPARARVRADARKWVASKLKPKKYGDKVTNEHEHTGEVVLRWKS